MTIRRVGLGVVLILLAGLLFWTAGLALSVESFSQLRESHRASDVLLLDRHGRVLHERRVDPHGRRLAWVTLSEVSPQLVQALIQAEDRRFLSHSGVDWRAMIGAISGRLLYGQRRGASTLTMQLASQMEPQLRPRSIRRSWWQKLRQIRWANAIERSWSKAEILEAYLNLVSFRGEVQGIGSACRGLLGKRPHGVNQVEALFLTALLPSPNAEIERIVARAERLRQRVAPEVSGATLASMIESVLTRPYEVNQDRQLALHAGRRLVNDSAPAKSEVKTSLDADLQQFAEDIVADQVGQLRSRNVRDAAVIVASNETGEVLAYVGGSGPYSSARFVDGAQAHRQAGSTLKPFLYGLALERKLISSESPLRDTPLNVAGLNGVYRPSNYDNLFRGVVSARVALASSLNIPAVRVIEKVGVDHLVQRLRELGFSHLRDAAYYGPSLALGSADISLWELVNAYRTMANRGLYSELTFQTRRQEPTASQVFDPKASTEISEILSDRENRSLTFGLENPLSTRFWSAVKTGTSKDMRDNWCVGYSRRYTVGVWVGNFSGEPMWNVTGVSGAGPIWRELIDHLHRDDPTPVVQPPRRNSAWQSQMITAASHHAPGRIAYPTSNARIALDPDIPPDRQRVFFEAEPSDPEHAWVLNGDLVAQGSQLVPWRPVQGSHWLKLQGPDGQILDQVRFTVIGLEVQQQSSRREK